MKLLRNVRVWVGIAFIALLIMLRFSGIGHYFTLEEIQNQREHLMHFVSEQYWWAVIGYIALYIVIVVSALPLAALGTVAGGYLFGLIPTVIYTNIGATIGATLFFLWCDMYSAKHYKSVIRKS